MICAGPEPTIADIIRNKRGLAVIVTCDYEGSKLTKLPGTNIDASEMEKTIEELKYGKILLKNENATESSIMTEIGRVSGDLHLLEDKIIIFVFSGHGATGDQIVSQKGEYLSLKNITQRLLARRSSTNPNPPVLFFIDACRGSEQLKSDDDLVKGLIEQKTNFRLDYATVDHHVSHAGGSGSRWLLAVAQKLRNERNKSLQNIMADVKKEVWEGFLTKQQPQSVDQLNCGTLYLHPLCTSIET